MNVCLLNDSFPPVIDGVANTVVNYARILTERGAAHVQVGTPRYPGVDYNGYPFEVVTYRSFSIGNLVEGYRAGNPLDVPALSELSAGRPDIIHTHCPVMSTMVARSLRMRTKAPVIFTYHTKFDVDIAHAVKNALIQKEAVRVLVDNIAACDEVWTVSQGAGENLRSLGYAGDYRVVENGVDFPKGRADDAMVREATKDVDLPAGVPVYLFVGRLMRYKGLPMILDALRLLRDQGRDFRMVFIGGGADEEELRAQTERNGLGPRVVFTGPIRDREKLRAWNTRADLFLFPSTYDTNGIVVREAAACGLASVLIRDSCAAEGVTDGRNGFLIGETPESMASLLLQLGDDLGRMREAGQYAMDELYISWEESVMRARGLYDEVLAKKEAGAYQSRWKQRMQEFRESDRLRKFRIATMKSRWRETLVAMGRVPDSVYESMETMAGGMHTLGSGVKTGVKRAGRGAGRIGRNAWLNAKEILYGPTD